MDSRNEHSSEVAAASAEFGRASGYGIESHLQPPSQTKPPRGRRRTNPPAGIFDDDVVAVLRESPEHTAHQYGIDAIQTALRYSKA